MYKVLNGSYLDDVGQMMLELETASLTTYELTMLGLNMKYKNKKLTAEQMELYSSDIQKAKFNGLWDYDEEQRIISTYLKNIEIYEMVKQLSPSEQLTYFIEKNRKSNNEFGLFMDEAELLKCATKMVANIRG